MPTPNPKPTELRVLSAAQLRELRRRLPKPQPRAEATPQEVGFLLGIQAALLSLEEGFVV